MGSSVNTKAILYCRVSREEQAREGVSLEAQEERLRAYAAMRGMQVVDVVIDAGVSGGIPIAERAGGKRVLAAIRAGCGNVVAYKLDRLFRDCADCLRTVEAWQKAGVAMHLVDLGGQAVDTSSAMGRFFLTVMAGAAELERNQTRERTKMALVSKKQRGERTGNVPLGFRLADDGVRLLPDDGEQAVIAKARELRKTGASFRAIGEHLLDAGMVPRVGREWHATTVMRMCGGVQL